MPVSPADIENSRLQTDGGIKYKLESGPSLGASESGVTAKERYIIKATDCEAFLLESIPPPQVFGAFIQKGPRRRMPGSSILFTKSVSFDPFTSDKPGDPFSFDPGATAGTYNDLYYAAIEYEFSFADDDDKDENDPTTFLEQAVNVGGEFLNLSAKNLKEKSEYDSSKRAMQDPLNVVSKIIPSVEHSLTWKFALKPPWETIVKTLGKVNSGEFKFGRFNTPEEHVLFVGVAGKQEYVWGGQGIRIKPWNLDFKFLEKRVEDVDDAGNIFVYGWQHVYSSKDHKWVRVLRMPGERDLYELADFNQMFKASTT